MRVTGSAVVRAPRERVWEALADPAVLARALPGCRELEPVGADAYRVRVAVAVISESGDRTRSYNCVGEMGIDAIRRPTASSIADAIAADPGITPASPAPLRPSGFSGDGVCWWSMTTSGTSEA